MGIHVKKIIGWMLPLSDAEQKTLWDWMNAEDRNIQHLIEALGSWRTSPPKDETFSDGDYPPGLRDMVLAERRHVDEGAVEFLQKELKNALKQLKPKWRATLSQIMHIEDGLLTFCSPFDAVAARSGDIMDYYENECESKLLYLCPLPPKLTEVRSEAHRSANGTYPYDGTLRRCYGSPRVPSVKLNTPADAPLRYTPEGTPCALYFDDFMAGGPYNQITGRYDPNKAPWGTPEDVAYLLEHYRPVIPDFVLIYLWFLKTQGVDFTLRVNDIRPVIFTFWS